MVYKRVNELVTEYLSDDEAKSEKEIIRKDGSDRLAKLLDANNFNEWDKVSLELEYSVESGMKINKTVDDYKTYINKLIIRILEKGDG